MTLRRALGVAAADLYHQAWRLDEHGSFVEPVGDSAGLLISRGLVRAVELLEPEEESERGDGEEDIY